MTKMMRAFGAFCAVLFAAQAVFAAECDPKKATSKVSLNDHIQPLLGSICASCHNSMEAPEGLVLEAGFFHDLTVNSRSVQSKLDRVEPGDPEASYIVHKLRGTHESVGGSGNQMPAGLTPLSEAEMNLIIQWIKDCSPDN